MKHEVNQFRREFWQAAAPAVLCAGALLCALVLPPAFAAVSHALAHMEAQRPGGHMSVLDMTPEEKEAIMTNHHVELLTSLHAQFLNLSAQRREAQQAEARHASAASEQTIRTRAQCLGYVMTNYNGIAQQTPGAALDQARLPRTLP